MPFWRGIIRVGAFSLLSERVSCCYWDPGVTRGGDDLMRGEIQCVGGCCETIFGSGES